MLLLLLLSLFLFLGPHMWYMEVPRLEGELELQLKAYATGIATPDPSHICNLCHGLEQCQIFNPLREVRYWTCIFMDTSWVPFHWATMGTPICFVFIFLCKILALWWTEELFSQLRELSALWNMRSQYWYVMNICEYFSCSKSEPTPMVENPSLNDLWWTPSFISYIGKTEKKKRVRKLKTIDLT